MGSNVGSKVGSASGSRVGSAGTALEGDDEEGSLTVGFFFVEGDALGSAVGCWDGSSVNAYEGAWEGAPSISSVRVGEELGLAVVGVCVGSAGGHPGQSWDGLSVMWYSGALVCTFAVGLRVGRVVGPLVILLEGAMEGLLSIASYRVGDSELVGFSRVGKGTGGMEGDVEGRWVAISSSG
jgi:hypothetical protein